MARRRLALLSILMALFLAGPSTATQAAPGPMMLRKHDNSRMGRIARSLERLERRQAEASASATISAPMGVQTTYETYTVMTPAGMETWDCTVLLTPITSSTGEPEYDEDQNCTVSLTPSGSGSGSDSSSDASDPAYVPPPLPPTLPTLATGTPVDPLSTIESVLGAAPTTTEVGAAVVSATSMVSMATVSASVVTTTAATAPAANGAGNAGAAPSQSIVVSVDGMGSTTFLIPAGLVTSTPIVQSAPTVTASATAASNSVAANPAVVSSQSIVVSVDDTGSTTFMIPAAMLPTSTVAGTTMTVVPTVSVMVGQTAGNDGASIIGESSVMFSQVSTASSASVDPSAMLSSILNSPTSVIGAANPADTPAPGNEGASIVGYSSVTFNPVQTAGSAPSAALSSYSTAATLRSILAGGSSSSSFLSAVAASAAATNSALAANAGALTSANDTTTSVAAVAIPGQTIQVLPIGLGVFAGITVIALIVVGIVTFERTQYRKAFRARKLAEQGGAMGYGGMAERAA